MLFSSFWKRGPGPPLWGPGGSLDPWTPPPGSTPGFNSPAVPCWIFGQWVAVLNPLMCIFHH